MSEQEFSELPVELLVPDQNSGERLDSFLADQFPRYSRVLLRKIIAAGGVSVDGKSTKVAYRLHPGQVIRISLPPLPRASPVPENIPLEVLFEDEFLVAINKPANMVVHPARGHWSGTLTSALAFHFENLSSTGGPSRPGIVHRLDRETSGVMVIAKTDEVHMFLASQFEARTTIKEYFAIVCGKFDRDRDLIDLPIGTHPYQREKMAIRAGHSSSRPAQSFYEVDERFANRGRGLATVRVLPRTGRTHQIRLHLAHIGCPVLCDKLYGGRSRISRGELLGREPDQEFVLERQALHARRLTIAHPGSRQPMTFDAPLPEDLQVVLAILRQASTI